MAFRARKVFGTFEKRAPGQDGIPPDILKYGSPSLKSELLKLYNACWQNQRLPPVFKDALIVTIYKTKGERTDCGNHREISLLPIAGEALPESQCEFRGGKSTTEMILSLRQLQKKAVEQQKAKAFDTAARETLGKVLKAYGCPDRVINFIRLSMIE